MKGNLDAFGTSGDIAEFSKFHRRLKKIVEEGKIRVWFLVDEAADKAYDEFQYMFPEEQESDIFHFILTGSLGISSFVGQRHLDAWVWDCLSSHRTSLLICCEAQECYQSQA